MTVDHHDFQLLQVFQRSLTTFLTSVHVRILDVVISRCGDLVM